MEPYLNIIYFVLTVVFSGFTLLAFLFYVTMFVDVLDFRQDQDYERRWRDRHKMAFVLMSCATFMGFYLLWMDWREIGGTLILICAVLLSVSLLQSFRQVFPHYKPGQ